MASQRTIVTETTFTANRRKDFMRRKVTSRFGRQEPEDVGLGLRQVLRSRVSRKPRAALDRLFDPSQQDGDIRVLRDKVVRADLKSFDLILIGILRRQENNRKVTIPLTDSRTRGETVENRHHHVKEENIRALLADSNQSACTVTRCSHGTAIRLQKRPKPLPNRQLVIYNQNLHTAYYTTTGPSADKTPKTGGQAANTVLAKSVQHSLPIGNVHF